MILDVTTSGGSYPIYLGRGELARAGRHLKLDRKSMIVTDENIPTSYVETVKKACKTPVLLTLPAGEGTKTLPYFEKILGTMLEAGFTRTDCVVALGGGVIGDLAGFAASAFLRASFSLSSAACRLSSAPDTACSSRLRIMKEAGEVQRQ